MFIYVFAFFRMPPSGRLRTPPSHILFYLIKFFCVISKCVSFMYILIFLSTNINMYLCIHLLYFKQKIKKSAEINVQQFTVVK